MFASKLAIPVASACALLLSGCATEPSDASNGFTAVTEPEFQSSVVGRSLDYDKGGSLTFNSGGTLSGTFPEGAASGTWAWEAGRVCSRTTVGSKTYDRTCRTPQKDGDRIRFLQADGSVFSLATMR